MFQTENFRMEIPLAGEVKTYSKNEMVYDFSGSNIARTNADADLYTERTKLWESTLKETWAKGGKISAGSQVRLSDFNPYGPGLELSLGATDYGEFIGTNVSAGKDPEYMARLVKRGEDNFGDPDAYFSNVLAICSAVETTGGERIVGLRSEKVGEYPRTWHTVGGHPVMKDYADGKVDLFDAMERQVVKELGVEKSQIEEMVLTGLMINRRTRKPELTFKTKLSVSLEGIQERYQAAAERDEHAWIFGVRSNEGMISFLNANQDKFAFPAGHGLNEDQMERLARKEKPDNTSNYFVPSGEAAIVMDLAHSGVDVLKALPYVRRAD